MRRIKYFILKYNKVWTLGEESSKLEECHIDIGRVHQGGYDATGLIIYR